MSGGKVTKFPGGQQPEWKSRLITTREGDAKACTYNLMLVLENDPELAGLFWLDEFGNRVVLDRDPAWQGGNREEFTEIDAVELSAWIADPRRGYGLTVGTDLVLACVEAIARRRKRHSVREYLEGLQWDGTPRVERLMVDLFGAEDTAYNRGASICMMVSAVSRILWTDALQPHKASKVDFMVVLEGKQGRGKTTGVLELFTAQWYAEATESPAHKDFYQCLRGCWVVEIGEMESFSKAEVGKVKQAITTRFDTYRPSYGRSVRKFRRECVFVGTTNTDEYLRDASGARRFLPVLVGQVDIPAIVRLRDQLWAEAVAMFRQGTAWWALPPGAEREQDARFSEDVWTERIYRWTMGKAGEDAYRAIGHRDVVGEPIMEKYGGPQEFTVAEVLSHAVGVDAARQDRAAQTRVGQILTRLGFGKYKPTRMGERVQVYYHPDPTAVVEAQEEERKADAQRRGLSNG